MNDKGTYLIAVRFIIPGEKQQTFSVGIFNNLTRLEAVNFGWSYFNEYRVKAVTVEYLGSTPVEIEFGFRALASRGMAAF